VVTRVGITEGGDASRSIETWQEEMSKHGILHAILITKNPTDEFIEAVKSLNGAAIVHTTITGWGGTELEPNVPTPDETCAQIKKVCDAIGKEKVVLRIDPILVSPEGERRARDVYDRMKNVTGRVRISFLDMYPHVRKRMDRVGFKYPTQGFHASIFERRRIAEAFPTADICGEPGFPCTGCLSETDLKLLGIPKIQWGLPKKSGQRAECACLALKQELIPDRKPCKNSCLYCYWRT